MVTIHGSRNSENPGPEIPQIGASAFSRGFSHVFQAFSFRKWRNIGLLRGKHPRFCLESTEVWVQEVRCFWHIPALPSLLFPRSGGVLRGKNGAEIRGHCAPCAPNLPYSPCRTHESASFSALEGTLHIVRIFEGLHPFSAPLSGPRLGSRNAGVCFPVSPSSTTPAVSPGLRAWSGVGAETYLPDTFHPCIAYRPDILCAQKCHAPCTFHHENCSTSILFH